MVDSRPPGCDGRHPHLQRQGRGSIINTASVVAIMGAATFSVDGGISAAYVTPL